MAKEEHLNLNLTPELPEVVSQDFNLFYKPEVAPVDAGYKRITTGNG